MKVSLSASQQKLNHSKQGQQIINYSMLNLVLIKQRKLQNLNLQNTLQKINKEKMYGKLVSFSSKVYPDLCFQGNKLLNTHYSSALVRNRRLSYLTSQLKELPQHKQQIRRYSNIISKRKKQMQGGIDSFWLFKKTVVHQQKKKKKGQLDNKIIQDQSNPEVEPQIYTNKTEQAYLKIACSGKQNSDINSLIPRITLKNYMTNIFGQVFATRFLNFYMIKSYISYKQFETLAQKFTDIKIRQSHLVSFFIFDESQDGFISPKDVFSIFQRQFSNKVEKDILKIIEYTKKHANQQIQKKKNLQHKIQNVVLRDDWLTIKDYQMYFKKLDQPYLKATNKKDTVFSKSFAVIDHRQKIRSTRKQINQKKNMFNELFGAINQLRKNTAYIQLDDYMLNYSTFYSIFGQQKTEIYNFFANCVFGI